MEWLAGMRCVIVDTANVLARCPELVGTTANVNSLLRRFSAAFGSEFGSEFGTWIPPLNLKASQACRSARQQGRAVDKGSIGLSPPLLLLKSK